MKRFKKKAEEKTTQLPSWEEIVSRMYDEELYCPEDYIIVKVIYSADKAHRYVVFKSDTDYLTYVYEKLQAYDEYELTYFPSDLPAYWLPNEDGARRIFNDIDIFMRELKAEPQYKTFFD